MAAAGRNGHHHEPFIIWLFCVRSQIKDPPSNWMRFLSGVRGVWGFKTPDYCYDVSLRHHSINRVFKEHTPTHSWQKAELIGRVSLASDRTDATNGHLGNKKTTTTEIAAINIDVMTTVTVMTVGARRQCPRMQERHRGSGVAPEPDKWLTMSHHEDRFCRRRPWSNLIRGVGSGGWSIASTQRSTTSYVCLQGDFLPRRDFLHQLGKKSRILIKKSSCLEICSIAISL